MVCKFSPGRWLLLFALALVCSSTTTDASASGVVTSTQIGAQSIAPTAVMKTSKSKSKKKHKNKNKKNKSDSGTVSISLNAIGTVKKGQQGVDISGPVSISGLPCTLKLTYSDGTSGQLDGTSNGDRVCAFKVDIPNRDGIVGTATAKLSVRDKTQNNDKGSAEQTFIVTS